MGARRDMNSINSVVIDCAATPNGRAYSAQQIDGWHQFALVQWQTLRKLIQGLEAHLDKVLVRYEHNQLSTKSCPGFDVPAWGQGKFRPLLENLLEGRCDELV